MLYRSIAKRLLFLLPAERAHHVAVGLLRVLMWLPFMRSLARALMLPADSALETRALGLEFPNPVGLAAGFDKDAVAADGLLALGFGFVEVGTLTGQPQQGNPQPRLFRLPADRALINRMGFNNHGSADAARRLAARSKRVGVVGANIGKTKLVPEEGAIADYVLSAERLAPHAAYMVVNVSSPNTPGLRDLQAVEKLRPLLVAVREAIVRVVPSRPPSLLVKIAPDLSDDDVDAVADLALELGLAGIVATNTTIVRDGLETPSSRVAEIGAGGLSGAPLEKRSLEVIRRLRARVGDRLVLVAAGGIENAEQAWARIKAGATLVQVYTGFIYEGPGFARALALGLSASAKRDGYARVQDAVGVDA